MKIPETVAKKNQYSAAEVELLKIEVELFLKKTVASQAEILAKRSKLFFPPAAREVFFRNKERNEKIGRLLQYLLAFLVHAPASAESPGKQLNPLEQFRELIRYELDLLLQADVKKAVFNEINQMGSRNGENVWDYQERIVEKNRELNELVITGAGDGANIFFTLCLVLEHLCLFWFDIKQGDMRRIRSSDIFMYKLARILQGRCRQTPGS